MIHSQSGPQSGYYRFPSIHGDRVVFVCEDDLWTVPIAGGTAIRLTANLGEVTHPVLSPDGQQLAFIGREEGNAEVYVMPAEGGSARRLTFLGASTKVVGWSQNGQSIIFASDAGEPFRRLRQLYRLSAAGGLPERLPYGMAHAIALGPNGSVVLGRNVEDPARWKRYRGGLAGVLWIDATDSGQFERLLDIPGNLASPMWVGDRIYFISDHEGIGNIYSCTPTGQDLKRLTEQQDYYVRNATTDGQRIVYHAGGELYAVDLASGSQQMIPVQFLSPQVQRQRKFIDTGEYLEDYDLHPKSHSTLITSRGRSFSFGHWEGAVTPVGAAEVGRYRLTRWLNDETRLVTVCDRSGKETLEILSTDFDVDPVVLSELDLGRAFTLSVSPVANQVVLSNHRHELIWVDLDSRNSQILARSQHGQIHGFDWSPDGQWVVYGFSDTQHTSSIKLCRISDGAIYSLTSSRFLDFNPAFDPQGKFIYFLSVREFNPVYDSVYFDLNFPQATRPFLISLQKDTPSPFIPVPKPLTDSTKKKEDASASDTSEGSASSIGEIATGATDESSTPTHTPSDAADADSDDANSDDEISPLKIDFDGVEHRVVGFPVGEGRYHQIWGLKDKVLFSSVPVRGSMGEEWASTRPSADARIELYDFTNQTCELVVATVSDFKVGRDHSTLLYRSGDRLRVCTVKANLSADDEQPSRKTGWLDLHRVRIAVSPQQEWQQMFREIWRLQQEQFWTPDLSGVDWERVYQRYRPLLDRVSTRSEFSDLVWEMQGELGTSHAYEIGGDYREEPDYRLGFLGADFAYDSAMEGYRITHIAQGDAWTNHASPLQQIGLNVQVNDVLLAVDGQRLSEHRAPHELLVHQANCPVQLTVADRAGENRRTVTVKTLRSERSLRYREWVEQNHQAVAEATAGRVGYVHIPDMAPPGYAEFHRYYFAELHKEGLIVDVRFNGGGHVSQLILEKLARRRIGYAVSRWEQPEPYPCDSVSGPIVAITNEHAGSDGDIFSHCFKLMGIGPLIGTRTWGGVIGIWPRHGLVDGSIVTQPEYSFWFKDVGWSVENYGTEPDIPVEIPPHNWAQGNDLQLDKAIQVVLKELEHRPVQLPEFNERPRLQLP